MSGRVFDLIMLALVAVALIFVGICVACSFYSLPPEPTPTTARALLYREVSGGKVVSLIRESDGQCVMQTEWPYATDRRVLDPIVCGTPILNKLP